ncbi:MAG TPA: isoprenylcysteine carboxylmethyltransferase family protein [Armatimonadota bacterium]
MHSPQGAFDLAAITIVQLCVMALVIAVILNFARARGGKRPGQVRRSPVATGSMTAVLVGICLLIQYRVGVLHALPLRNAITVIGLLLLITGTLVNILGRVQLGRNWANQATVYADQTLVTSGLYGLVRHPLYASLIWMCYGGALVYHNAAAVLATLCLFYPMMIYRAGIEEAMLVAQFPAYADYQARVGRFFPRIFGGADHAPH